MILFDKETAAGCYPTPQEVADRCDLLRQRAERAVWLASELEVPLYQHWGPMPRHHEPACYVRFEGELPAPFYAIWQPALSGPAPTLVHLPGYGAEMSLFPELVFRGWNVLHVSPAGYATPEGFAEHRREPDGRWPVLPETIRTLGRHGYTDWISDVLIAVKWLQNKPEVMADRIGFFGTSQGGGTSLILASILGPEVVRAVAADVPFLTDFVHVDVAREDSPYALVGRGVLDHFGDNDDHQRRAWRALGHVDTLSHAHRLTQPVLLTAGGADDVCPPATIEKLFDRLPGTRSYTHLAEQEHGYTPAFLRLAAAWFDTWL
jgi:cephalosporin-C deacetylase-like acetyl esterase